MENEDLTRLARWVVPGWEQLGEGAAVAERINFARFARWAIPGWVAIALLLVFLVIDYKFAPNSRNIIKCLYGNRFISLNIQDALSVIVLLVVLSIPLGFIIYQIYYYFRWNSPFSRDGSNPFFNSPGRLRETNFVLVDFSDKSALYSNSLGTDEWRKEWIKHILFAINHKFRWRYIELLFYDTIFSMNNGRQWLYRYRYRQEILHTLGTVSVSVAISFVVYLLAKMSTECLKLPAKGVGYVFVFLMVYFVTHWLMNVENETFWDLYEAKADKSKKVLQGKFRDLMCENDQLKEGFIRKMLGKWCIWCDFEDIKPRCVLTEFIKIWRFIVPHPTYMVVMAMLAIFVMSSSIFIDYEFLVHDVVYVISLMFIISIPILLWISVYRDYRPTIVPNMVWFALIIETSAIILYVRYYQHGYLNLFPGSNTFSNIGMQDSGVNSISWNMYIMHILGITENMLVEEVFRDNGFIINLIVFIFLAYILTMNRNSARLELLSLIRYTLDRSILKRGSASPQAGKKPSDQVRKGPLSPRAGIDDFD